MTYNTSRCRNLRHERKEPARIKGMSWDITMPKMSKAEHRKRIQRSLDRDPRFIIEDI